MKVDLLAGTQLPIQRATSALSFAGDGDFASKLTLGQIIKGRVLRSYEGGRYLVDFSGQQKVVDSAVPLRTDEVIVGRVVGLSERVELQRINAPSVTPAGTAAGAGGTAAAHATGTGSLPIGDSLAAMLERLQATAGEAAVDLVQRTAARAAQPLLMAKAGLFLSRLGLPLSAEALRLVYNALQRDPGQGMFALPHDGIRLETSEAAEPMTMAAPAPVPVAAKMEDTMSQSLGAALANLLRELPEARSGRPGFDAGADGQRQAEDDARRAVARGADQATEDGPDVARLILNVQSGGAIAHRVGTLPLVVDGRLHELDIALFEQASGPEAERNPNGAKARGAAALRHRQVVFAVSTEALGTIEVRAAAAGANLRIAIGAPSRVSSEALAQHAAELATTLGGLGWSIDELAYRTTSGEGLVGRTVLEHLVAPGSVSTLA